FEIPLLVLSSAAATNQAFTSYGEMDITSCPITYFGKKYDKVYVICFNGHYNAGIQNDCILMSGGTADRGDLKIFTKEIPIGSGVHELLPSLSSPGKCVNVIPLKDSQQTDVSSSYLEVLVSTLRLVHIKTTQVLKEKTMTIQMAFFSTKLSFITSSGVVYKPNTSQKIPSICSTVTCGANGVVTAVSDCDPTEHCDGNGGCVFNSICTVTGFTIIDFPGRVHFVPDRCGYILLKSTPISGLQVLGVFQERRRKDVSFLERVIIKMESTGAQISLEQGGRVLQLTPVASIVQGVELSRNQSGITAKISGSSYTVYVHFDGEIALIHMTGPSGTEVQGLCGSANTTLGVEKAAEHSDSGCDVQQSQPVDSSIDCPSATEWCNVLKEAPFYACNAHIDPEPYISACTEMLCKYPPVDGLRCQFMEAYVKSCSYHSNVNVEGWESDATCSIHDFCQDMYCSDHEFCGRHYTGEAGCLCRALFASPYKATGTFGEPTVCEKESASISLAKCLLEDQSINYRNLKLNDQTCQGELDSETHMVTFYFDGNRSCGTVITTNGSRIAYKNTIMTPGATIPGVISRKSQVQIDLTCCYSQPDIKKCTWFSSSVTQQIVSGQWSYNLTMEAYTNTETKKALGNNDKVLLNQKIWVDLKTEGLDKGMVAVVVESCWGTNEPLPSSSLKYDIIIDGCPNPADNTVQVMGNGRGSSTTFFFNAFQFTGKNRNVFLHCRVRLCVQRDNDCIPVGGPGLRRRSIMKRYEDKNPGLINLVWTY
uniref:Alpha-tectorin-like n=1 Tax=Cynoglossus semilaevis TaxID=244447 RepID=A0A3P8V557_CYNSE